MPNSKAETRLTPIMHAYLEDLANLGAYGKGKSGQRADSYLKVVVTFEKRGDGGLRAYSDDVPGLVLSGPNPEAVFADVIPALETLFEHNRHMEVQFAPVGDVRSKLEEDGLLPISD